MNKKKDELVKIKLCDLVLDFDIYPRNAVDTHCSASYAEAVRAGSMPPPMIIDKKTKRVVDGFTRTRALRTVFEPEHEVDVIARNYRSETELTTEAVRMSALGARALSTQEKVKNALRLARRGVERDKIAAVLKVTDEKIALLLETRTALDPRGNLVDLKISMENLAGMKLKKNQDQARKAAIGHTQLYTINSLINLLVGDAIDWSNAAVVERMNELLKVATEKMQKAVA
jgi:hypothetical protein